MQYDYDLIDLYEGHNYWTIRNSELSNAGNGIYTHTPGNMTNLTVENNAIHDIGTTNFYHKDAHAVGVQNGMHCLIRGNRTWNTGEAICFWSSTYEMKDNTICHNFIRDVHVKKITGGNGIAISGGSEATLGKRTGFKIYGNIIMHTGLDRISGTRTMTGRDSASAATTLII